MIAAKTSCKDVSIGKRRGFLLGITAISQVATHDRGVYRYQLVDLSPVPILATYCNLSGPAIASLHSY